MSAQTKKEVGYSKEKSIEIATQALDKASPWMIENAIRIVLTDPDHSQNIMDALVDKFKVVPFGDPTHKENDLPRFILQAYSIYSDIFLLERKPYKGSIYEYWLISNNSPRHKPPLYNSTRRFIVTKTDNPKGTREIIKESDQFFHEFSVDNKVLLSIDAENDLEVRETLGAWLAPQNFKNHPELPRYEVILDAKGHYSLVPR